MKFLNGIDIPLDKNIKSLLANNLLQEIYKKNTVIFSEGEFGNNMYIIKEGEVCCKKNGKIVRILKQGENFGQKAILFDNKRTMDIIANTDCVLYSISVEFFKNHADRGSPRLHRPSYQFPENAESSKNTAPPQGAPPPQGKGAYENLQAYQAAKNYIKN
jgi:hypothetical protein